MHPAMGAGVAAAALVLPACLNRHVAPRRQRCALPRPRKRTVWRAPASQCQAWVGSQGEPWQSDALFCADVSVILACFRNGVGARVYLYTETVSACARRCRFASALLLRPRVAGCLCHTCRRT